MNRSSIKEDIQTANILTKKCLSTLESQYKNLKWNPNDTKSLQMVIAAMKLKDTYSLEGRLWPTVRGHSTLRDPICCIFFCSVLFLKESIFLTSSWKIRTSRAAHSSQDWDHEKGHLLGFLSVTPFSDLFSYAPLTQDIECFLALWRLLFSWLCFCLIFTA